MDSERCGMALPASGLHEDVDKVGCEECDKPLVGRSQKRYCSRPCAGAARTRFIGSSEYFWERVDRRGPDDCWVWTKSCTPDGYGHLRRPGGKYAYSHRVAYEELVGPIPAGLHLDHLCRNKPCCNPAHLEPVEHGTNVRRGMASYELRKRCRHGHDMTEAANIYTAPKGDRRCRPCMTKRNRSRSQK